MIPVSTQYDEYIDWPKLTEQKNPFVFIVPPLSRGVGTTSPAYIEQVIGELTDMSVCGVYY